MHVILLFNSKTNKLTVFHRLDNGYSVSMYRVCTVNSLKDIKVTSLNTIRHRVDNSYSSSSNNRFVLTTKI